MSIKTRFLLSYVGVVIISIILLLVAGFLIIFSITGDPNSIENFYKKSYVQKPLTTVEESAFLDLKLLAKHTPEQLLNEQQLKKIKQKDIEIVVRKDKEIEYATPSFDNQVLVRSLPGFEETNINTRDTIKIDDFFYTYVKFDFYFSDESQGSIFVLRKASSSAELARELFPILFGLLLFLFIMIIGLLNYLVSRSIIKPISLLKEGANRIKSGDLNFETKAASNDEIGQLNRTFDEMRIKLKESVKIQLQYEENRKELLSNISHDLKTPITSIIGYVEGIQDGVANTPQKMEKYLSTIHLKAKDLDSLIDELFLFSKLDLNKEPFTFESVDLNQFIRDYVEEFHLDFLQQGTQIEWNRMDKPIFVTADREKLRRVLANLISNCVKYAERDKVNISISLHEGLEDVVVQVTDNGQGIEPSALPFIFNRFYRAEQSRNSQTGGSGLGLAIAKQIIREHQGDIWATSEKGKGTSVFFTLKKGEPK
ncbi:HAMP domain-containing histidine kinase [Peribacillus muralis]|uniref:sensor histidine kinase n=1 Tax=Peribacillus muralis TaxID=264697 RepID=UPI001F4D7806|nr:HAMP domain-containing sensor histidine kinase [Peribacillus muralis]MCK1991226.1 HAMP domain-containing histidine kinase [Peribacillus muralis]MCK2011780.1 HAMP domain-containing histidine kinase [Peribacillus muralis]